MTEVLEQKIENLTEYIKNLDISQRAEDETYKSILAKIAHRLNELEVDENLDILEIKDRIKFLTDQIEETDNSLHLDKLTKAIDGLSINQDENLQKLNEIIEKVERLQSENNDTFNNSVNEIKSDLDVVRQNAQNATDISNEVKQNISDAIQNIESKFNEIFEAQNSSQEDYKYTVTNNLDDIKGQLIDTENSIKKAIKESLDDFSIETDIPNKLEYLVQSISTINKDTSDLVGEVENLKFTSQETSDNTSAIKEYLDSTKDDLKNNIRKLQEQFVLQMLQVFDNISFTTETEEIIDFVDESNYAIKTELETLQKEIAKISKEDSSYFNEHFNKLCDLVTSQTSNEFNLLKEVATEIKKITANSENSDEYTYSLPDIENDLAKIRLILKELQTEKTAKDEQDLDFSERFEILNEDISSISKRTNKLILTAESTNKQFKEYLDEFKGIMNYFSKKNRQPFIEQKLDGATRLLISNAKSSQILNEAFMHFAEWVDETTNVLETNKNMLEGITTQSLTASERLTSMEKELEKMNKKIEARIDENKELQMTIEKQNKLIAKLEQKLDKLSKVEATVDDDTKSVIEYIATQTGVTAENTKENGELADKLEFIEHKISSLNKNIQKIISYIDEE